MPCPEILSPYLQDLGDARSDGFTTTDAEFVDLVAAVEKTAWDDVRDRIFGFDDDKRLDVRTFAFVCYLAWREGGMAAIAAIQEGVLATLGTNLACFGPPKKKEAQLDVRLAWAFSTIVDDITYHEKAATPEWKAWTKGVDAALVATMNERRSELRERLGGGQTPRSSEAYARLVTTLDRSTKPLAAAAAKAAEPPPAAEEEEEAPDSEEAPQSEVAPPKRKRGASGAGSRGRGDSPMGGDRVELAVSHAFLELLRKLDAFEQLVKSGKHQKAALVADDITALITNFDPRSYFPELFAGFGKNLAENIEVLADYWDQRDTIGWKALEQYYRVDLQRFIDG